MNILDLALIGILTAFVLYGLRTGIIYMVGTLVGMFLGIYLAGKWYEGFSTWFASVFHLNPLVAKVFGFGILMTLLNRFIGIAFYFAYRVFSVLKLVPGVRTVNRLGGAALGFVEGLLAIGLTLYLATKFSINPTWTAALKESTLTPLFVGISNIVVPLLPGAIKSMQTLIVF